MRSGHEFGKESPRHALLQNRAQQGRFTAIIVRYNVSLHQEGRVMDYLRSNFRQYVTQWRNAGLLRMIPLLHSDSIVRIHEKVQRQRQGSLIVLLRHFHRQ